MTTERALRMRAVLFFPADRPERYDKAVATGADAVCIDLEDAVGPGRKEAGRAAAVELLARPAPELTTRLVRMNAPGSREGDADLEALVAASAAGHHVDALVVPKVGSADELRRIVSAWGRRRGSAPRVIPLVETAQGLEAAAQIARAEKVAAVLLGGVDLAMELGCEIGWDELLYARSRLVHAAALARVPAIDMCFLDVRDTAALAEEARRAARLGLRGKIAIHPAQVAAIQGAFTPAPEALARARAVVEAYERAGGGVALLDGRLVEMPVVEAALRTLAAAEGAGT